MFSSFVQKRRPKLWLKFHPETEKWKVFGGSLLIWEVYSVWDFLKIYGTAEMVRKRISRIFTILLTNPCEICCQRDQKYQKILFQRLGDAEIWHSSRFVTFFQQNVRLLSLPYVSRDFSTIQYNFIGILAIRYHKNLLGTRFKALKNPRESNFSQFQDSPTPLCTASYILLNFFIMIFSACVAFVQKTRPSEIHLNFKWNWKLRNLNHKN